MKRSPGLDFLRGIAVLLVIFRHSFMGNRIAFFGWLGVDLFFVLSGFLIAGILFTEYKEEKKVNVKRFLLRRAFKIIPPFYFFIVVYTLLNYIITGKWFSYINILNEAFYLQSNFPGIAIHTWSLAVEEHFYIVFSLIMLLVTKGKAPWNLRSLMTTIILFFTAGFVLRLVISYPHKNEVFFSPGYPHIRMDGIFMGIMLAYIYHFTSFTNSLKEKLLSLIILAFILILPGFIFHGGSFIMNTIGTTLVCLGFTIFCFLSMDQRVIHFISKYKSLTLIFKWVCFIGLHSYSIYLWHIPSKDIASLLPLKGYAFFSIYLLLSLVLGTFFSFAVEKPFLKIRENISSLKRTKPII